MRPFTMGDMDATQTAVVASLCMTTYDCALFRDAVESAMEADAFKSCHTIGEHAQALLTWRLAYLKDQ